MVWSYARPNALPVDPTHQASTDEIYWSSPLSLAKREHRSKGRTSPLLIYLWRDSTEPSFALLSIRQCPTTSECPIIVLTHAFAMNERLQLQWLYGIPDGSRWHRCWLLYMEEKYAELGFRWVGEAPLRRVCIYLVVGIHLLIAHIVSSSQ